VAAAAAVVAVAVAVAVAGGEAVGMAVAVAVVVEPGSYTVHTAAVRIAGTGCIGYTAGIAVVRIGGTVAAERTRHHRNHHNFVALERKLLPRV